MPKVWGVLGPRVRRDVTCSYCGSWFVQCVVAECQGKGCKKVKAVRCLGLATCAAGLLDAVLKQEAYEEGAEVL